MKEVLEMMDPLPGRISELLSGPGRVTAEAGARRCLAFLEKELRAIVAGLRQLAASAALGPGHADSHITDRLAHLRELAGWTRDLLHSGCVPRRPAELPELNLSWIEQLLLVDSAAEGHTAGSSEDPCWLPRPHSSGGTLPLVGIDGPRKKLLRWLITALDGEEADKNSLRVISVVGPAGVGKTTLAMELHRQTGGHYFQCYAAVKMSQRPPGTRKLLRHIMSQIIDSSVSVTCETRVALEGDEHELAYDMNKYLQDKRYLIVIDDLWRASDWEVIQDAFPHNKCGSRILITTRIRSVARSCSSRNKDGLTNSDSDSDSGQISGTDGRPGSGKKRGNDELVHEVKPLGELDSERLFSEAAFGASGCCPSDHFKQVSDEILKRCGGIPLFIIAMAGLMKQEQAELGNKTAAYWLERIPELRQVEEALSPSYDDLPNELKLLSLYMSKFPRGYIIDKDQLVRTWGAEGLIVPDMWRPFEEMADEYFSKLLDRGIIHSEVVSCCQVNYFMLRFLASMSARKNFAVTSHTLNLLVAGGVNKSRMLQRLSLHQPDPELPMLLEEMDFSHTRSLTVSGAVYRIPLDRFVHMVVLDLEGWKNLKDDDLVQICSSKFSLLKYLSVSNTLVSKLPPQIIELGYLETLDISHTQINELPQEMWELPELRALDIRSTQVRLLPEHAVYGASCLRHLLVNSDTMDGTGIELPKNIVRWMFLETLETVDLSNCSTTFIEGLAQLRFLEVLAITWSFHQCYNEEYQRALRSAIQRSGCLRSLTIHCEMGCSMEFLDSLPDAPQSLQHIRITARFLTIPKWIEGLNHLVFLDITVCKLEPHDIELLGSLERLETIVLGLDFLPEVAIVIGEGVFEQLLRFSIDCRMPWLDFREGAMLRLTELDLLLSTGPAGQECQTSGIANLLSLDRVTLRYDPWYINCRSIKAAIGTMRRQVAELGYTVKLVNNGVEEDVGTILAETSG